MRATLILLAGLMIGCSDDAQPNAEPNMTESTNQWHFFPCSMGDDQAFIYLNTGISDEMSSAPASLAKLRLAYKAPRTDGLPTNKEFEPVKDIEDRIVAFSREGNDWYVGRATVAGNRIFYVYTSRDEPSWMRFVEKRGTESGYDVRLTYSDDPAHKGYHDELYPTEDDWQVIKDLQVIEKSLNTRTGINCVTFEAQRASLSRLPRNRLVKKNRIFRLMAAVGLLVLIGLLCFQRLLPSHPLFGAIYEAAAFDLNEARFNRVGVFLRKHLPRHVVQSPFFPARYREQARYLNLNGNQLEWSIGGTDTGWFYF